MLAELAATDQVPVVVRNAAGRHGLTGGDAAGALAAPAQDRAGEGAAEAPPSAGPPIPWCCWSRARGFTAKFARRARLGQPLRIELFGRTPARAAEDPATSAPRPGACGRRSPRRRPETGRDQRAAESSWPSGKITATLGGTVGARAARPVRSVDFASRTRAPGGQGDPRQHGRPTARLRGRVIEDRLIAEKTGRVLPAGCTHEGVRAGTC